MEYVNERFAELISSIDDDLSSGLRYTHTRLTDNTKKALESSSFLYALIELLSEKGLISIDELDERKRLVAERLVKRFTSSGIGLMYQDPEYDKYTFEHAVAVDCGSRLQVCKAICCKIPFALSCHDVDERIVRWEFGRPYLIAHDRDGYCVHLQKNTYRCSIHDYRPLPCRGFDCRDNDRWNVWMDYAQGVLNTEICEKIDLENTQIYAVGGNEVNVTCEKG